LECEASLDVVPAGFGLVFSTVDRPVHGGVDELFCLVADVEQASDLGEGQANAASARRRRRVVAGGAGGDGSVANGT